MKLRFDTASEVLTDISDYQSSQVDRISAQQRSFLDDVKSLREQYDKDLITANETYRSIFTLVSSVVSNLLHSFRVWFSIFSTRFECSFAFFTQRSMVSDVDSENRSQLKFLHEQGGVFTWFQV